MQSTKIKTYKSVQQQKQKRLLEWVENNNRVKQSYAQRNQLRFTGAQLIKAIFNIK